MKKNLITLVLVSTFSVALADDITNPILKILVKKGILTKEEALEVEKEAKGLKNNQENLKNEKVVKEAKGEKPPVKISSKAKKLKFEGLGYLGYTFKDRKHGTDEGNFEIRRGYFITKFYLNNKDYFRFTLDVTKHAHKDNVNEGNELDAKIKHLYFYKDLSNYIYGTGFEIGMVHTPWLDYEEHSGWWYRSVEKTFFEATDGAHLLPSADAGINFKTKTEYISAEYGIFDGEGYDHLGRSDKGDKGNKPMIDGRLTVHLLGGGTKKPKPLSQQYANISLHALNSFNHRGSDKDLTVYQIHAVYNQPLFLIAGQYIKSDWYEGSENDGKGYSFNFEIRPLLENKIALFGRYDHWKPDDNTALERDMYIYGLSWKMNKYVKWILNGINADYKNDNSRDYKKYMLSTEVHF